MLKLSAGMEGRNRVAGNVRLPATSWIPASPNACYWKECYYSFVLLLLFPLLLECHTAEWISKYKHLKMGWIFLEPWCSDVWPYPNRKKKPLTNGMCLGPGLFVWLANGKLIWGNLFENSQYCYNSLVNASCAETAHFERQKVKINKNIKWMHF